MLRMILAVPLFLIACSSHTGEETVTPEVAPTAPLEVTVQADPVSTPATTAVVGLEPAPLPEQVTCSPTSSCEALQLCCAETDCFVGTQEQSYRCRSPLCADEVRQLTGTVCK